MNFSSRLAISIVILVACTGVTGLAVMLAMNNQYSQLQTTDERYEELRGLYEIGSRAQATRLLLSAPAHDPVEVRRQLLAAVQTTDRLLQQVSDAPYSRNGQLGSTLENIRTNLEWSLVAEQNQDATSAMPVALNACLSQVAALSGDANAAIIADRKAMTARLKRAWWLLGGLAGATLVLAVALGVAQHRAVARPLWALRQGVERVARHRLDEPIVATGPREFQALIAQFNHMRGEIRALQDSLNRQVEIKSHQLIRSERLAGLGYLAAGLAHEINNPLGVIGGHAETMLRRLEGSDAIGTAVRTQAVFSAMRHDLEDALRTITDEVFRCQDITQGLLQMTRAGAADEKRESIDLLALVQRIVHMLQRLPLCRDRRLLLEPFNAGPVVARGHRAQLTQVLVNLITNALEATESGDGLVRVGVFAQNDLALIRIDDNGCGMTDEVIQHAFDPLFTDKPRRGLTGFGLGLSISHAIIERHGGRIEISSGGPGRGSSFVVELPAVSAVTVGGAEV